MTDTPKILRDMTDAEIGALVRAEFDGKKIHWLAGSADQYWCEKPVGEQWIRYRAYRIAPPKFLPLEVGKVYRTTDGLDKTCIAVRGNRAWMTLLDDGMAYPHDAATGRNKYDPNSDIIGPSENQETGE